MTAAGRVFPYLAIGLVLIAANRAQNQRQAGFVKRTERSGTTSDYAVQRQNELLRQKAQYLGFYQDVKRALPTEMRRSPQEQMYRDIRVSIPEHTQPVAGDRQPSAVYDLNGGVPPGQVQAGTIQPAPTQSGRYEPAPTHPPRKDKPIDRGFERTQGVQ